MPMCCYAGIQVMILQKDVGSYPNLIHVWTYIIAVDSIGYH